MSIETGSGAIRTFETAGDKQWYSLR